MARSEYPGLERAGQILMALEIVMVVFAIAVIGGAVYAGIDSSYYAAISGSISGAGFLVSFAVLHFLRSSIDWMKDVASHLRNIRHGQGKNEFRSTTGQSARGSSGGEVMTSSGASKSAEPMTNDELLEAGDAAAIYKRAYKLRNERGDIDGAIRLYRWLVENRAGTKEASQAQTQLDLEEQQARAGQG